MVRDVRLACADLRIAEGAARLSQETTRVLKQLAAVAESRLRAGDLGELEATTARVAALNAEQDWVRARANIELARGRLGILLGLERDASGLRLADPSPRPEPIGRSAGELTLDALANRPDLRATELAIEAAGKRAGLARKEIATVTPAMCLMLLPGAPERRRDAPLVRLLKRIYGSILPSLIGRPYAAISVLAVVFLLTGIAIPRLGEEFLPNFKERDFLMHWVEKPGTSLEAMRRITV